MDKARKLLALLMAVLLTVLPGCAEQTSVSARVRDTAGSTESTVPVQPAPSASPEALRQEMAGTGQLFAVACFGYHETIDSDLPADPLTAMLEQAPQLCREYPFLLQIPEERVLGTGGELYCIVPLDADAPVAVTRGHWDETLEQYIYLDTIYHSEAGEPILVFCNGGGWEPDIQIFISGASGEVMWYPQLDDQQCAMPQRAEDWYDLIYDFSPYREMLTKRYRDMEGEWALLTEEMLRGSTWCWEGFLKDGREVS